jgi:predicted MFS family arabinose efflux permease
VPATTESRAEILDELSSSSSSPGTDSSVGGFLRRNQLSAMIRAGIKHVGKQWTTEDPFRIFKRDRYMRDLAIVVLAYYTSVWALVSTLMVYVTSNLHLSPVAVGWLLSSYGLGTMFSESVLVRIIVPYLGEMSSIRVGLAALAVQSVMVAFSTNATHIFISLLLSMITNLVYPSVSSLVTR